MRKIIYLTISVCFYVTNLFCQTAPTNGTNGELIGGISQGKTNYSKQVNKFDILVKNKDQFLAALKNSMPYSTIYIQDDANIDLTGQSSLGLKTGITLASGRGKIGSKGARIYTTKNGTFPLFECGSYVKIIGLRIEGPDKNIYFENKAFEGKDAVSKNMYSTPISEGIRTSNPGLLIENCEISGWTHAGIVVKSGGKATIINNYIHHNRRYGLGYGINVDGGFADIESNLFDFNRHNIAGTGIKNSSYTAVNNVFLENGTSHAVDMHGGVDRKDNTNIAGSQIIVNNNYFLLKNGVLAVLIRGVPTDKAEISNNTIVYINSTKPKNSKAVAVDLSENKAIIQKNAVGNMKIWSNKILTK